MKVKSELSEAAPILPSLDRPIRFLMLLAGFISGAGVYEIKSIHLQRFCSIRHLITCAVLLSFLLSTLILTWDKEKDKDIEVLLVKIATLFWMTYTAVNPCVVFAACHGKWGLEKYYEALCDVEQRLGVLGAKISYKKISAIIYTVTAFFIMAGMGMGSSRVVYHVSGNPFFFFGILNENATTPVGIQIFNIYQTAGEIFLNFIWTITVAYFIGVCGISWVLIQDYNTCLEKAISEKPEEVMENIATYRIAHLRLTGLVAQANKVFSAMLGLILVANVAIVLFMLYVLSFPDLERPADYITWVTLASVTTILFVIPSDRVAASTIEAHDSLLEILQDKSETVNNYTQLCQMQMFLSKLRVPEGFSAAGLMDINKELGITIVGVLASYYIVMVQFHTAAPTPPSPTVNSTTASLLYSLNLSSTTTSTALPGV